MVTDRILLIALGKGSVKAFDALYGKYAPKVEAFLRTVLASDAAAAEDLLQNIFLKIWQDRKTISEKVRDFDSYLFVMARNAALNLLERERSRRVTLGEEQYTLPADDAGAQTDLSDILQSLYRALDSMTEQRARVFRMSREQGMSNKQIAEVLGISTKTVEYHIGKALSEIRKNLN